MLMKKIFLLGLFFIPVFAFAQSQVDCSRSSNQDCTNGQACPAGEACWGSSPVQLPSGQTSTNRWCVIQDSRGSCIPSSANGLGGDRGNAGSGNTTGVTQGVPPCTNPVAAALTATQRRVRAQMAAFMRSASVAASRSFSGNAPSVFVNPPRDRCGTNNNDGSPYWCPAATPSCCSDTLPPGGRGTGICVAYGASCVHPHPNPNPLPQPVCTPACNPHGERCIACMRINGNKIEHDTTCIDVSGPGPIIVSKMCP